MDIPRQPRERHNRYVYGVVGFGAVVAGALAIIRLGPAVPSVDRASLLIDSVRRGTMVRQVRGPGTLVPEQIRWIPAVTAGRVERKLVLPGTPVDSNTLLLTLTNPEVQLELLEAQRQLSDAKAGLVNLRTTLETGILDQEAAFATLHAQHLEALRTAAAADSLAARDLIADAERHTARERSDALSIRIEIARRRLDVIRRSAREQTAAQEGQVERLRDIVSFQRNRVASLEVRAGTAGVLQDMALEEGQWVLPGQTLARVVRPERLKAVLRIPEVQARDVALGQPVLIDTRTDTISGRVIRIDPAVQNATVAVDVAIIGDLPPGARPDLSVFGTIEIDRVADALFTARPAYGQANGTVTLFRLVENGAFAERVTVRLGRASVRTIEILEGLAEGHEVILSDMSQWDDYQRVRLR